MVQDHFYLELVLEVPGQAFGGVHTPVLASRAAKADLEIVKASFDIILHRDVHDGIDAPQELIDFGFLFQVILHCLIPACQDFKFFHSAGIQNAAAVEDKSTSIPEASTGIPFLYEKLVILTASGVSGPAVTVSKRLMISSSTTTSQQPVEFRQINAPLLHAETFQVLCPAVCW